MYTTLLLQGERIINLAKMLKKPTFKGQGKRFFFPVSVEFSECTVDWQWACTSPLDQCASY